jgi:hypothetical protein
MSRENKSSEETTLLGKKRDVNDEKIVDNELLKLNTTKEEKEKGKKYENGKKGEFLEEIDKTCEANKEDKKPLLKTFGSGFFSNNSNPIVAFSNTSSFSSFSTNNAKIGFNFDNKTSSHVKNKDNSSNFFSSNKNTKHESQNVIEDNQDLFKEDENSGNESGDGDEDIFKGSESPEAYNPTNLIQENKPQLKSIYIKKYVKQIENIFEYLKEEKKFVNKGTGFLSIEFTDIGKCTGLIVFR